jgi:sugar O-acyltransferase (sialic acid O-acetyltransferase NeuD family)
VTAGPISIIGTRSFAAEVADFAEAAGFLVERLLEPYARDRVGERIHGYPVVWLEEASPGLAVVGTGERSRRDLVARALAAGFEFPPLVHPRAHVARTSTAAAGAVIGPGVVVGASASVGEHAVLGRGVLVGHHTEIGAFATLNPGVNVAGNAVVEEDAFIGMAAIVRDHTRIGASATVGAGALVLRDVDAGSDVRGLPATVHARDQQAAEVVRDSEGQPDGQTNSGD